MKTLLNITFAFLLITLALSQSGCMKENSNTSYPDVTASADTISGILKYRQTDSSGTKVVAWPFGTAVFKVTLGGNEVIASANVDSAGKFTVILPATVPGNYFLSLANVVNQQAGTLKVTPETVRFMGSNQYNVEFTKDGSAKTMVINPCTIKSDFTVDKSYYFNFYDLDGTFTGTGETGNTFNWTFTKGWGAVESYKFTSTAAAFNSKSVSTLLSNTIWVN